MRTLAFLLALLAASAAWATGLVVVEDWTQQAPGATGIPDGWTGGQTWGSPKHDFTVEDNDGRRILHLRSRNESSTITRELEGRVRLRETPILEWSWKVVSVPKGGDARAKNTDDQAAQLYVVWPRFPQALRSRIIGYIWDTQAPRGARVKSEKTGTITYLVVRSGTGDAGKWLAERRNVVEDYRAIFGEEPEDPGAVSIAIDSDDTNSSAEAFFGAIVFRKP